MDGQFSFLDANTPEHKEIEFLNSILPKLKEAVESHGGNPELFQIKPTKVIAINHNLQAIVLSTFSTL